MASSPDDGGNVLRFEQEEAQILQVTAKSSICRWRKVARWQV
ncbi:MAG: hypothetical protein R3E89_19230 [Thiolinea sp.]